MYHLNDTSNYHRRELLTLGWELTVCNALESKNSPIYDLLNEQKTFGYYLYDLLNHYMPLNQGGRILEVGGGYGYIMRDFLSINDKLEATMLDISPVLLRKQQETLHHFSVAFIEDDSLSIDNEVYREQKFVILNEMIGDLPTVCNINASTAKYAGLVSGKVLSEVIRLNDTYNLGLSTHDNVTCNIGALLLLEKLGKSDVPFIFISEHSCEIASYNFMTGDIQRTATTMPQRIILAGHDEYSIKFSHLESISKKLGYEIMRGSYSDFIKYKITDELHFIMSSNSGNDRHEVIRHFVDDIYCYEYLILIRV